MAHCAVRHCWSPDSRFFLTATLAPRMNVDNGFQLFKYNGIGPILTRRQPSDDPLYHVDWQPELFPNRGPSPKRALPGSSANANPTATVVKAAPYRPPGSTGALSEMLKRETAPMGKIKSISTSVTPRVSSPAVAPTKKIPGLPPAPARAPGSKKGTYEKC